MTLAEKSTEAQTRDQVQTGLPKVQLSHFSKCPCEPGVGSSLTPSTKSSWHPLGRLPCIQKPLPSARGLALPLPKTSSRPPPCVLVRAEAGVLKDPVDSGNSSTQ